MAQNRTIHHLDRPATYLPRGAPAGGTDQVSTAPGDRRSPRMPKPTPQAGILNRPTDHALFAALDLTTTDPATSHAAIERLRELIHKELRSQLDETTPSSPKEQPSA